MSLFAAAAALPAGATAVCYGHADDLAMFLKCQRGQGVDTVFSFEKAREISGEDATSASSSPSVKTFSCVATRTAAPVDARGSLDGWAKRGTLDLGDDIGVVP
jgi:hypothetical protein